MKAPFARPSCYVFDFPQLDTVVEVEPGVEEVIIRASRSTFSERRKHSFIRELAAEGFIDSACRWREPECRGGVHWVVDPGAFLPGNERMDQTRAFMVRLIFSSLALWLILMGVTIWRAGR